MGRRTRRDHVVDRGLDDPRPDDVINIDNVDWLVVGAARLEDGVEAWTECRLADASNESWLVVCSKDPDCVLFGQRMDDPCLGGRPSGSIDVQGRVFRLRRQGAATVSVTGDLGGVFPAETCRYWEYQRPGEERLWIRGDQEGRTCITGRRIRRHMVGFLPGS